MGLADKIRDYCIQRAIRKGKEEKVYRMLVEGIWLIDTIVADNCFNRADTLITRAQKLIENYGIHSRRVQQEIRNVLHAYSET